jgi:hypothetical protein
VSNNDWLPPLSGPLRTKERVRVVWKRGLPQEERANTSAVHCVNEEMSQKMSVCVCMRGVANGEEGSMNRTCMGESASSKHQKIGYVIGERNRGRPSSRHHAAAWLTSTPWLRQKESSTHGRLQLCLQLWLQLWRKIFNSKAAEFAQQRNCRLRGPKAFWHAVVANVAAGVRLVETRR